MSKDYTLEFNLSSYEALDNFALLADQKYNLGDRNGWFNYFRGGLRGLYARVMGVKIHYHKLHAWELEVKTPQVTEYNLSSLLFNMDSAIECAVFALNALGYIADSRFFVDINDENKIKSIAPYNVIGKSPVLGYDRYFPSLKEYWCERRDLIHTISEQHDVSKHRQTIYIGGRMRNDPPTGFFEAIKTKDEVGKQIYFTPMSEIILMPQPKTPWHQKRPSDSKSYDKLENVAEEFCAFINVSGVKALEDARITIKLNYYDFIRTNKEDV
jgi:hypothetical protein